MLGAGLYVVSDAPPAPPFSLYNVFVGIKKCDLRDLIVKVYQKKCLGIHFQTICNCTVDACS